MNTELLLATAAAELLAHAEATSDIRFKVAAGILMGKPGGRRRRDRDAAAVAEIAALFDAGQTPTHTEASRLAAKSLRERIPVENTVTRLMRKYRETHGQK
jgi:hypothetical protein